MDAIIPTNYIMPKILFTGVEDHKNYLTTFNAQMIISGGTNAIHCKMFMGTFTGTTLQWFSGLPDGHIISFNHYFELLREQCIVNHARQPVSFDLFGVKQKQGECLKNFLNRFRAFTVKLQTQDEALMVHAFG